MKFFVTHQNPDSILKNDVTSIFLTLRKMEFPYKEIVKEDGKEIEKQFEKV